jgi:hypothetical protein
MIKPITFEVMEKALSSVNSAVINWNWKRPFGGNMCVRSGARKHTLYFQLKKELIHWRKNG